MNELPKGPSPGVCATLPQFREAARTNLSASAFDYFEGGSETEATVRRNRVALDQLLLNPRVLIDVSEPSLETDLFGHRFSMPIMIAPIGDIGLAHPAGATGLVNAAEEFNIGVIVSAHAATSLPEIRQSSPKARVAFQMYPFGPSELHRRQVSMAEDAECFALCITVDTPVFGRRERDLRNGFEPRQGPQPNFGSSVGPPLQAAATWNDLERLRRLSELPMVVKGVLHPDDAKRAVSAGMNAIYVSNHGGRRLDYGPAAIDVLPGVMEVVAGHVPVLADGGVEHATDVVKGLAMGAQMMLIGRLAVWGLAADGEDGVKRVLELLKDELRNTLALMGVAATSQLGLEHLLRPHQCQCPGEAVSQ